MQIKTYKHLLEKLKIVYPNQLPHKPVSDLADINRKIGQQDVIGFIEKELDKLLEGK